MSIRKCKCAKPSVAMPLGVMPPSSKVAQMLFWKRQKKKVAQMEAPCPSKMLAAIVHKMWPCLVATSVRPGPDGLVCDTWACSVNTGEWWVVTFKWVPSQLLKKKQAMPTDVNVSIPAVSTNHRSSSTSSFFLLKKIFSFLKRFCTASTRDDSLLCYWRGDPNSKATAMSPWSVPARTLQVHCLQKRRLQFLVIMVYHSFH